VLETVIMDFELGEGRLPGHVWTFISAGATVAFQAVNLRPGQPCLRGESITSLMSGLELRLLPKRSIHLFI
jgi:hypothetical protein